MRTKLNYNFMIKRACPSRQEMRLGKLLSIPTRDNAIIR
jgi:hypothetical protein